MFYIYKIDHLDGSYKIWKMDQPRRCYETSSQANAGIRDIARDAKDQFENYRAVFFSDPMEVTLFVSSVYYSPDAAQASMF